jgi:hypothetical protein
MPLRRKAPPVLTATSLALGIALLTASLKTWLKLISRPPLPGRRTALSAEDAVFWVDWVAAGTVTLISFLGVTAESGVPIRPLQVGIATSSLLFGYSILPFVIRQFGYDKKGKMKAWPCILIGDTIGLAILLAAVAGGTGHIG